MNQLSPEARSLLRSAAAAEQPASLASMRRVRQGVRLAVLGVIPAQAAVAATASVSTIKLASWVIVGLSVGAAGLGVTRWVSEPSSRHTDTRLLHDAPRQTPSARPAGRPRAMTSVRPQSKAARSPARAPQGRVVPPERPPHERLETAPAPAIEPGLKQELMLLSDVQALLRRGDGQRALELLDQHRGPLGGSEQLADERLAAETFAACAAGQLDRARRAAQKFLERAPGSPLAPRVRSSCGVSSP
jgi:hypothetical protein